MIPFHVAEFLPQRIDGRLQATAVSSETFPRPLDDSQFSAHAHQEPLIPIPLPPSFPLSLFVIPASSPPSITIYPCFFCSHHTNPVLTMCRHKKRMGAPVVRQASALTAESSFSSGKGFDIAIYSPFVLTLILVYCMNSALACFMVVVG